MWNMIWPVFLIVASNTAYNICAKSTPERVDAFASLTVTYLVAAVCTAILFFITAENKSLSYQLEHMNMTSVVLGVAIVGLEFGYICAYRNGWMVSTAQLVCSLVLSAVLMLVGVAIYKETLSVRQLTGLGVCVAGLILLTGK